MGRAIARPYERGTGQKWDSARERSRPAPASPTGSSLSEFLPSGRIPQAGSTRLCHMPWHPDQTQCAYPSAQCATVSGRHPAACLQAVPHTAHGEWRISLRWRLQWSGCRFLETVEPSRTASTALRRSSTPAAIRPSTGARH